MPLVPFDLANGQRSPAAAQDGTSRRLVQRVLGSKSRSLNSEDVQGPFKTILRLLNFANAAFTVR
jgi:hypothetical protein